MGWLEIAENPFSDPFVRKKTAGAGNVAGDTIVHLRPQEAAQLISCGDKGIPTYRRTTNCLAARSSRASKPPADVSILDLSLPALASSSSAVTTSVALAPFARGISNQPGL